MINRTLGFNSIKSIYVQISRTRKWGNLNSNSGIQKKKKYKFCLCRDKLHWQKVKKRGGWPKEFNRQEIWKLRLCLFSSHQQRISLSQPISGSFFHSIKFYHPGNYIDWEKEQTWPIYNTVNSPLFQALSSYTLYVVICPLVTSLPIITSTGKRGESQINSFNYLLAMLVSRQGKRKWEPPLCSNRVLHL